MKSKLNIFITTLCLLGLSAQADEGWSGGPGGGNSAEMPTGVSTSAI